MGYMRSYWSGIFTYSDRSTRAEFWAGYLGNMLIIALSIVTFPIVAGIASAIGDFDEEISLAVLITLWVISVILFFLAGLAAKVRRFHDTNTSGWWVIVCYIPLANIITFLMLIADTDVTRTKLSDEEVSQHLEEFFDSQWAFDLNKLLRYILSERKYEDGSWSVYFFGDDKDEFDLDIFDEPIEEKHVVVEKDTYDNSSDYIYISIEKYVSALVTRVNELLAEGEITDEVDIRTLLEQISKFIGDSDSDMVALRDNQETDAVNEKEKNIDNKQNADKKQNTLLLQMREVVEQTAYFNSAPIVSSDGVLGESVSYISRREGQYLVLKINADQSVSVEVRDQQNKKINAVLIHYVETIYWEDEDLLTLLSHEQQLSIHFAKTRYAFFLQPDIEE